MKNHIEVDDSDWRTTVALCLGAGLIVATLFVTTVLELCTYVGL